MASASQTEAVITQSLRAVALLADLPLEAGARSRAVRQLRDLLRAARAAAALDMRERATLAAAPAPDIAAAISRLPLE